MVASYETLILRCALPGQLLQGASIHLRLLPRAAVALYPRPAVSRRRPVVIAARILAVLIAHAESCDLFLELLRTLLLHIPQLLHLFVERGQLGKEGFLLLVNPLDLGRFPSPGARPARVRCVASRRRQRSHTQVHSRLLRLVRTAASDLSLSLPFPRIHQLVLMLRALSLRNRASLLRLQGLTVDFAHHFRLLCLRLLPGKFERGAASRAHRATCNPAGEPHVHRVYAGMVLKLLSIEELPALV